MRKYVTAVCILSILLSGILMVGCGSGGSGEQSAEAAAKTFFSGFQSQDAASTWDLLSASSQKAVKKAEWESYLKQAGAMKFEVLKVTVDGDKATAEVSGTIDGQTSTEKVPLVKENGAWKVDMAGMSTE